MNFDYKKIIIFGGTSEGRTLSEKLCEERIPHTVCVATKYGEDVLNKNEYALINEGRLDREEIEEFIRASLLVIDATHPYATLVSENIKTAAKNQDIKLIRIQRESIADGSIAGGIDENSNDLSLGANPDRDIKYYNSLASMVEDLEKALEVTDKNILLTTGSKQLGEIVPKLGMSRVYVRVLPSIESLQLCEEAGIPNSHIIAMHGPFDTFTNRALIRQYNIGILVTKESGTSGGYLEKIEAAKLEGVDAYVLKRPAKEDGVTVDEAVDIIKKDLSVIENKDVENPGINEKGLDENKRIYVNLIGLGMGDDDLLTGRAKEQIKKADSIFGAKRLISNIADKPIYDLYQAKDIVPVILEKEYKNVCVLFSGDTGFYSGASTFAKYLEQTNKFNNDKKVLKDRDNKSFILEHKDNEYELVVDIIPGISSISYLSSKIGIPYSDGNIISLHGKNDDLSVKRAARKILNSNKSFVIFSKGEDVIKLCKAISNLVYSERDERHEDRGVSIDLAREFQLNEIDNIKVYVGRNFSYEDETIIELGFRDILLDENIKNISKQGLYAVCFINDKRDILANKKKAEIEDLENSDVKDSNMPKRFMIAAPGSGSGKTMITCGLLNIFEKKYDTISFKCGPDYIDPMFHRNVIGVAGGNLDTCFSSAEQIREIVANCRNDFAVIEGVMGIYDGIGGTQLAGSSYDVAVKSRTPIILVVDAKGQGSTVMSTIKGIINEDRFSFIKGIILNRISERFYKKIESIIVEELQLIREDIKLLGFIPTIKDVNISSRHLGLKMPSEIDDLRKQIDILSEQIASSVDIEELEEIAGKAGDLSEYNNCQAEAKTLTKQGDKCSPENIGATTNLRLAVARDEAFCFYYEENITLFKELGVEIINFSPLRDKKLPDNIQGLLLGGGYPENYLKELSENVSMREDIKNAINNGLPTLAECGGFMYLQEEVSDLQGNAYKMCGLTTGKCRYTGGLKRFGYVEVINAHNKILIGMRGHEFHYYESSNNGEDCSLQKVGEDIKYKGMHEINNCVMGYMHMYYRSKPEFIEDFVEKMRNVR